MPVRTEEKMNIPVKEILTKVVIAALVPVAHELAKILVELLKEKKA